MLQRVGRLGDVAMEMDGVEDPPVTSVKPKVALEGLTSANTLLSSTINPAGI